MRKIVSRAKERKRKKRNQYILGAILIFVMFGSVFGIIAGSFGNKESSPEANYKGYEFNVQGNYWTTSLGNNDFFFIHSPSELNNSESLNSLTNYLGKPLYLFSEDYASSTEIYQNLNPLVQRIQFACLNEENCEEDFPIKTCEDNFIVIRESNITKISQQENCVFIEGKSEELTLLTDEVIYKLIGIKQ